jgi:DNA-binding response OmpR family regulator
MIPRILFVEDEAPMRDLLSLYLRNKGIEVTTAATGEEARELFCQVPLDLTILDLNLAGADGLEVLDFIKHNRPEHPVIIFTGVSDDELLVKRALAGRAAAVVRKMSSLTSLLAEVRKHLPAGSSAGEPPSGPVPRP